MDNVEDTDTTLLGDCNAEFTSSSLKGYHGKFHLWDNDNGMENLLSIPCLEEEGYHIEYARDKKWVLKTPQGVVILFKRDTGLTKGMTYINMRERK